MGFFLTFEQVFKKAGPDPCDMDFLTDNIEVDRSPIPTYTDHVIRRDIKVTEAVDTGLFYGYPNTSINRRNLRVMERLMARCHKKATSDRMVEGSLDQMCGANPAEIMLDQVYGVKSPHFTDEGDIYRRCEVMDIQGSIAKVCLIDFGDCAIVETGDLFKLTPVLEEQPIVCRLFVLSGVRTRRPDTYRHETRGWFLNRLPGEIVTVVPVLDGVIYERHRRKRTNLDSAEPKVLVYLKDGVLVNDYMRDN